MAYYPKNLNAETLAALRLPMLRLRIYETQDSSRDVIEHVESLSSFCCKLRSALDKEGATRTMELHFSRPILLQEYEIFRFLSDMRGLLSPPLTYSVTIVVSEEHRVDQIRLCPDVISRNAHVRCAMPPPPLLDSFS